MSSIAIFVTHLIDDSVYLMIDGHLPDIGIPATFDPTVTRQL